MTSKRNVFILVQLVLTTYVHTSMCSKVHENKHTEQEQFDINSAPLPSLHDGPQQYTRWPQTTTEKVKQDQHHHFVHKIENSPIPSAHEGPQPLKMAKRSAPMALDNKFKDSKADNEENYREATGDAYLNPQKPKYPDISTTSDSNDFIRKVHNYYGVSNTYGSEYKYDSQQLFSGYHPTSNIGVIPPRKVNARDYYNSISNLAPILKQHGGVYSDYIEKNLQHLPQYGNGGVKFNSNAYQNVLAALLMWNSMNNFNNYNYDIYTNQNITDEQQQVSFSASILQNCTKRQEELCFEDTKSFCTKEKTIFCTTTKYKPCQTEENACLDSNNIDQDMACIKNVTLSEEQHLKDLNLMTFINETLCVIKIAIPKIFSYGNKTI